MTLTDRDRKIVFLLVPIALIAAYWFLLLAPKRQEEAKVKDQLSAAQTQRGTAQQAASQLGSAKRNFASDYATVISLGKSIPSNVDMPSLLVQLNQASKGTGINFADVKTGQSSKSSSSPAPAAGGSAAGSSVNGGTGPAASSAPAQSGAGQAAQNAAGAVNQSNASSTASGLPAGGSSSSAAGGASSGSAPTGLDSVPLTFDFKGSFMNLADFFHRMKRFVRVANNQIVVSGRLIVINSFSFDASTTFPQLDAKVNATVYLAPKSQGVSAGATPQGPAGATTSQQASTGSSSTPPAATVTAP